MKRVNLDHEGRLTPISQMPRLKLRNRHRCKSTPQESLFLSIEALYIPFRPSLECPPSGKRKRWGRIEGIFPRKGFRIDGQ